jgi:hypothetical protein
MTLCTNIIKLKSVSWDDYLRVRAQDSLFAFLHNVFISPGKRFTAFLPVDNRVTLE